MVRLSYVVLSGRNGAMTHSPSSRLDPPLVARASELILSRKLFNSLIQLTDVHRAVGRQRDYPQQYPRAVALDNNFPHAPLDSDQLSQQCYHRIRFSLGSETYTAAEETTVETESTSPAHLQ